MTVRKTMLGRVVFAIVAISTAALWGQAQRKADWLADGADPQRTAWQRNETRLTKDTVKNIKLFWRVKLDNEPRQMHSLFPPLIAGNVATPSGTKEIAVVAGVSDNLF